MMRNRMAKTVLAGSLLLAMGGGALADGTIIARQSPDGRGAVFEHLPHLDPSETGLLLNGPLPQDHDYILILEEGKEPVWDQGPLDEIDRKLGGDGKVTVEVFPAEEEKRATPGLEFKRREGLHIEPDPEFTEGEGLRLDPEEDLVFDEDEGTTVEALPDGFQPRDGVWEAEVGRTTLEGCPAMLKSQLAPMLNAQPSPLPSRRAMQFSNPFDPNRLELSRTAAVSWERIGQTSWRSEIAPETFAQIPAGAGGTSSFVWQLDVAGEGEIRFTRTIHFSLPDIAVSMMGGGRDCRIFGTDRWLRVAD